MSAVSEESVRAEKPSRAVPKLVSAAVDTLCVRFEDGDYNPTPIIDLGALVANADGVVDDQEIEALRGIIGPMLGADLDAEVVALLVDASVQVIQSAGTTARIGVVAEILLDCDAVEQGIVVALAVAFASDGYSDAERTVIGRLARATKLPEPRLAELVDQVRRAYGG